MIAEVSQQKMLARKAEEKPEVVPPATIESKKVRIGVLTELQKKAEGEFFDHLKKVLEKRDDSELILLLGPVTYDPPYKEAIKRIRQKYQIDMIVYVESKPYATGEAFDTALVDTSEQKIVELGSVYVRIEKTNVWEKILVKKQIGPIENMIGEIFQAKATAREVDEVKEVAPTRPEPKTLKRVRIGLLTSSNLSFLVDEEKYVDHLIHEIGKRPDRQVVVLKEPMSYHDLDTDAARMLSHLYRIDILIGVMHSWQSGLGANSRTKLIDISAQRLIELEPVSIGKEGLEPGWEEKLVNKQIGPIENMVGQIPR
jgi:hypothetical protein